MLRGGGRAREDVDVVVDVDVCQARSLCTAGRNGIKSVDWRGADGRWWFWAG